MIDLVGFVHICASRIVCSWGRGPSVYSSLNPGSWPRHTALGARCPAFQRWAVLNLVRAGELGFSLVAAGPEDTMDLSSPHGWGGEALPLAPAARKGMS